MVGRQRDGVTQVLVDVAGAHAALDQHLLALVQREHVVARAAVEGCRVVDRVANPVARQRDTDGRTDPAHTHAHAHGYRDDARVDVGGVVGQDRHRARRGGQLRGRGVGLGRAADDVLGLRARTGDADAKRAEAGSDGRRCRHGMDLRVAQRRDGKGGLAGRQIGQRRRDDGVLDVGRHVAVDAVVGQRDADRNCDADVSGRQRN